MTIFVNKIAHVNLNVDSVNRELKFLTGSLNLKNMGHIQVVADDGVAVNIDGGIKWHGYRLNSAAENINATTFQLLEWERPVAKAPPYLCANNAGISHIAIKVPNLDHIYSQLIQQKIKIFDEPKIDEYSGEHFFCALNRDGSMYQFIEGVGAPELWFVNINCSNLEQSIRWYQSHLGFELVSKTWEQERSGRPYGIAGKVRLKTVRMQLPHRQADCGLQLQQWVLPATTGTQTYQQANSLGYNRIALQVGDVHESFQQLKAAGVDCPMPPVMFESKNNQKEEPWVAFLKDPDGTTVALLQCEALG